MNSAMNKDEKDVLAAELAMGLLVGEEADRAARLLAQDKEFASMHENWRERLGAIDATAPHLPGVEALWARIEKSLPVSAVTLPAVATLSLAQRLAGLWQSLDFWRPAGIVAAMASLVLALGLGFFMREASRQPVLVAVLLTSDNQPGAIVNVSADGRAELVPLGDIPVPAGRALQVWTLWDRVRGPVSIGLSRSARRLDLDLKALPRTTPTQLFEITLEPETGSPTGRPTGPILMKGNATTAL